MANRSFRTIEFFSLLLLAAAFAAGQTPTPTVPPVPSPSASPSPTPAPIQTLGDLQMKFRQSLAKPELRRGSVGIKVVSLASGKVVFEENAEKYFMPASNMKNFTVATAIEKLTPDFRFVTSIYAPSAIDAAGTINGDLRIFGRGDISMSYRFNGDSEKSLDGFADKIIALGVKRITGDIVGDDSYFRGFPIPGGWEWDDLQWWHGTEVSALTLNDSVIDISVKPGPQGYACSVSMKPYNPVMRVRNLCLTAAAGTQRTLSVHKELDQNILEISGTVPLNDKGYTGSISVSRPAELFAALLKQKLVEKGVTVNGNYRFEKRIDGSLPAGIEIGKFESLPFASIAANTMKPSQNMYTETLLWTLGEQARNANAAPGNGVPVSTADSSELGIAAVKKFLTEIGIAPDGVVQSDGSGLSRHDLITPEAVVQLYRYMANQSKFSQVWRDSLTIGGVDGTLRNRFRGTRAQANVRGKTGTIDQVSALSGYVKTAAGEEFAFSMVVNGVPSNPTRVSLLDEMVVHLANFTGKIDQ